MCFDPKNVVQLLTRGEQSWCSCRYTPKPNQIFLGLKCNTNIIYTRLQTNCLQVIHKSIQTKHINKHTFRKRTFRYLHLVCARACVLIGTRARTQTYICMLAPTHIHIKTYAECSSAHNIHINTQAKQYHP
jgi:hypothetical protein